TAARWRRLATEAIEQSFAAGRTPLLCGGSGLYLRTLMQGIAAIPDAPPGVRDQANDDWRTMGAEAFRTRLAEKDPEIVRRLKPRDRQRHIRAWEVWQATGRPLSAWQTGQAQAAPWRFAVILLAPERAWLRARIAARFDTMLATGVIEEARGVFARQPDPRW